MKNLNKYALVFVVTLFIKSVNAQTINWASLKKENKHIVNANLAVEHGVMYGLGYAYQVKNRFVPVIANVEAAVLAGNKTIDDFKFKIGGQIRWIKYHNFQFSTKINGVFRSYENDFVRLANFGSDLSGIVGYYRPKWFLSGEVGFDKAIVTHFKHSTVYKGLYPGVVDGWYEPSTGGNFYYGLQTGFSFKQHDLYLRGGKTLAQDLKTATTLGFYGQLGYNIKF